MIDILLAAFNGEKFIKEQIDSILNQTCRDWQLLIRDDGSTDATVQIIKSYTGKFPDKIWLIEDNLGNLGTGHNFGRLLEQAESEYIMFSDQDDFWLPEKIELTLNKMKEAERLNPGEPLLVFTDLKIVDENLNLIADSLWSYHKINPQEGSRLENLVFRDIVTGCTIMINKKLREISVPIPDFSRLHDWWITLKAAKYGKIFILPQATILYRQHSANVSGTRKKTMTPSVFIKKLKRFFKESQKDYKTAKQFRPDINPIKFVLKELQISIQRRI